MAFPRFRLIGAAGLCAAVLTLCGCGRLGDPVAEQPLDAPAIAYDTAMTFVAGVSAAQGVTSLGGPISAFSVAPPLPEGVSLNTATGTISGNASEAAGDSQYTVTASGPGGQGAATFRLRVILVPVDNGQPRPNIAYVSPVTDTVGKNATHNVASTGGPVTAYSVTPALPPGLNLSAATGRISGKPLAATVVVNYSVIASGPGGKDTAVIRLTVIDPTMVVAAPKIAYNPAAVNDTVGIAASHAPVSTGGPVTSYALLQPEGGDMVLLPAGLTLNAETGVLSGTPQAPVIILHKKQLTILPLMPWTASYSIVATGPGGKDTAAIQITVWYPNFIGPLPEPVDTTTRAHLQLNITLAPTPVVLARLIVALQSSVSTDPVVYDTITGGLQSAAAVPSPHMLTKTYAAKPLRNWLVQIRTVDNAGRIVHQGSTSANALTIGETRAVAISGLLNITLNGGPLATPVSTGDPVVLLPKRADP